MNEYLKEIQKFKELHETVAPIDNVSLYFQYKKFRFLDNFVKHNKPGKVLDVGSNIGHFSYFLYEKGFEVTGIDIDDKFLDATRKHVKTEKMNIKFIKSSATELPFKDNTFDYAICLDVLEHIPDKEKALQEIYRVLKNKGKLIAALPNVFSYYFGRKAVFSILSGKWNEHEGMTAGTVHYRFPSPKWRRYLDKSGFKIIHSSSDILLPIEPKILFYIMKNKPKLFHFIEKVEDFLKYKYPLNYLGSSFDIIGEK